MLNTGSPCIIGKPVEVSKTVEFVNVRDEFPTYKTERGYFVVEGQIRVNSRRWR